MGKYFTVTGIVDGDTFRVSPKWRLKVRGVEKRGNIIRPTGYDTPERNQPGFQEATLKLKKLILGKRVILKRPIKLTYGRLLCDVYFEGKNLADYFPEY